MSGEDREPEVSGPPRCPECGAVAKENPDGSIECDNHGIVYRPK